MFCVVSVVLFVLLVARLFLMCVSFAPHKKTRATSTCDNVSGIRNDKEIINTVDMN